ncbi:G-protein coupled receptor mth [Plakobranchus ocellatus]|uniref:G-protein coupled receptor mth n=1 Tax=Plakobranchus ocellatus TaxID=259542 RepID=A0AAV4D2B9_9GAST|nr:G-protein coupled receptor mth [Plakobranchus ocellatus]
MMIELYCTKILVPLLLVQLQFTMLTVAKETDKQTEKPIVKTVLTPLPEDAVLWENVTANQEDFLAVEDVFIVNISDSRMRWRASLSSNFSSDSASNFTKVHHKRVRTSFLSNFSSDSSNGLTVYNKNTSAFFLSNVSSDFFANSTDIFNNEFIIQEEKELKTLEEPEMSLNISIVEEISEPIEIVYDQSQRFEGNFLYWDKAMFTPEQYQMSVCRKTCINGEPAELYTFNCPTIACYNCICDRPRCEIYGICCPEDPTGLVFPELYEKKKEEEEEEEEILGAAIELNQYPHINDQDSRNNNPDKDHETKSQLGPETNSSAVESARKLKCSLNSKPYIFVQSCPSDYNKSQIKKLCEEDHQPGADTTLDLIAKAVDIETNVLYYNKYCAQCNGVFTSSQWDVTIHCVSYLSTYQATTMDQLLTYSLRSNSGCLVEQSPKRSDFSSDLLCDHIWFEEPIDRCNVTGLWSDYDEDVVHACQTVEGRAFRVRHEPYGYLNEPVGLYKNVFCAICNTRNYPRYGDCSDTLGRSIVGENNKPPRLFSFLLGFGRRSRGSFPVFRSSLTFSSCAEAEWPAPDGSCMPVHCSPGKTLQSNSCVTALDIRGLGYNLQIWFELAENQTDAFPEYINGPPAKLANTILREKLESFFEQLSFEYNVESGAATLEEPQYLPQSPGHYKFDPPAALWLIASFETLTEYSRDWIERSLVDMFIENTLQLNYESFQVDYQPKVHFGKSPYVSLCLKEGSRCYMQRYERFNNYESAFRQTHLYLNVTALFTCPYIQFSQSMFTFHEQENATFLARTVVTLTLGGASIIFSDDHELNHLSINADGTLSVCRDTLDSKLKDYVAKEREEFNSSRTFRSKLDEGTKAQYYLTLTCLCLSMLCLIFTLFTYIRFRVLRTAAGMNNIFLCASLLSAQASLLASVHVSGPKTLCTILGVVTHFLWLWMFAWTFICCFHMFRVFTAKTRNTCTDKSQSNAFAGTVVFSCLFPTVIVCTVMGVSHLTSGGRRTGYGHESCYLDSSLLKGLAMALPLCLISIANLVFFAITVTKIHNVRKLQSHNTVKKEDRKNLYIYIKLSTITGSFWLIQILAEALDSDILRFVAITANGLQGTFIFISYICNKRVLNLCLQSIGFKQNPLTTSENLRGTAVTSVGALTAQAREAKNPDRPSTISIDEKENRRLENNQARRFSVRSTSFDRKYDTTSSRSSGVHSGQDEGCAIDEDVQSDSDGQNGDCDKNIHGEKNWLESKAYVESEGTKDFSKWVESETQQRRICEFVVNEAHFLEHEDDTTNKTDLEIYNDGETITTDDVVLTTNNM